MLIFLVQIIILKLLKFCEIIIIFLLSFLTTLVALAIRIFSLI